MKTANQNRYLRRRKLFRTIFGVFSLSGILFAFQACYGTPQDFGLDVLISGKVTSAASKASVSGIKVMVNESGQHTVTADDGTFYIHCEQMPEYSLTFTDIDGDRNGLFRQRDTTMQLAGEAETLTVNIELN